MYIIQIITRTQGGRHLEYLQENNRIESSRSAGHHIKRAVETIEEIEYSSKEYII